MIKTRVLAAAHVQQLFMFTRVLCHSLKKQKKRKRKINYELFCVFLAFVAYGGTDNR